MRQPVGTVQIDVVQPAQIKSHGRFAQSFYIFVTVQVALAFQAGQQPFQSRNSGRGLVDDLFDFLVFTAKLALAGIGAEHDVIWQRFMFERSVRFYGIVRHIRQIGNFVVRTLKLAEQAAVAG